MREAASWAASRSPLVCLLANIHDAVAALDRCAGVATNAVELLIGIPAAVAGIGLPPKEAAGRAKSTADRTPGAAIVVGPHSVPRETRLVGDVGTKVVVQPGRGVEDRCAGLGEIVPNCFWQSLAAECLG